MKKIVASVGLVALGASSINAVYGQGMTPMPYKPWSISASLRGFYDDNVTTAPDNAQKTSTFGFEVSPSAALNWSQGPTTATLSYKYSLLYYAKRPVSNTGHYDQNHTFSGLLTHAFNQRYKVKVADSFVVGQEPDMLRYGALASNQRISGDNIRNYGGITLDATFTPVFGAEVGYDNAWYDYADSTPFAQTGFASISSRLNRIEHRAHVDALWTLSPETVGKIGYEYQEVDYTGDQTLVGAFEVKNGQPVVVPLAMSDARNSRSHIVYVGVDHTFLPELVGHLSAGVQYADFYNEDHSSFTPWVKGTLAYTYAPQSTAKIGFNQTRTPTDIVGNKNNFARDGDASLVFGSITHRIAPNLFGSVIGTFQYTTLNGTGNLDGKTEQFYEVGVNLKYRFNPNLSSEIGYNFDKTSSDLPSTYYGYQYNRNRVYVGVTATY